MNLVKYNPTRELLKIEKDFRNLFMNFLGGFNREDKEPDFADATWAPLSDIIETDDSYRIALDIPGVDKNDIKVNIKNGMLCISGERKNEKEYKNSNYYKIEKVYGKYYRSFDLPENIDEQKIEAEVKNGSLIVNLPKTEDSKPKQIDIKIN